jgi:hypothetical protein
MDYSLLDCQATFLNKKGRADLALEIAKRSVVSAPSEFGTWARLAEIYVGLEQWDLALLTLNSCPMFTYQDKDAPRMPEPLRVYLPTMPETLCDEIDDSQAASDAELVHPTLRKLHAAGFKGTFLKAYMLLTEITKKIGWDQLLRIRSQVFVMEEEYRHEKQTATATPHSRNASTVALKSPSPGPETNGDNHTESEEKPPTDGDEDEDDDESETGTPIDAVTNGDADLPKPASTITSSEVHAGSDNAEASGHTSDTQYTQFRNKRLCERWLDNLFMVLYEDLRVYTIWRTEMAQYRQQQLLYKKSAEEWEILGELAERLHHGEEACEAWQQCLGIRFSPKAMRGVLGMWVRRSDVRGILGAVIRLVCWQYRWYSEVCFPPSFLLLFPLDGTIANGGMP